MKTAFKVSAEVRQYAIVTGNYWAFTLTDGALRMLVVLYFYGLGYTPLSIALLFLFYELFGVFTNLFGGLLATRIGLNRTMNIGLCLQLLALALLMVPAEYLSIPLVMTAQAISGIAKDLNKMSAKSAIKLLLPKNANAQLFKWVALLTGSKNALKGAGFFLGGALLSLFGFRGAILVMLFGLGVVWLFSLLTLKEPLGIAKRKTYFSELFSKSSAINSLSAARLFLFGARDVWFVVALPVYLTSVCQWQHWSVGGFFALWIIGYGLVQGIAPRLVGSAAHGRIPDGRSAAKWALYLCFVPGIIAVALSMDFYPEYILIGGLAIFGLIFAINSSLHSYLIIQYASRDHVSLDVGFYYMANALGRLIGTVLSGWVYQSYGLSACLGVSTLFIALTAIISIALPRYPPAE